MSIRQFTRFVLSASAGALLAAAAHAQPLGPEQARAVIAPFYQALNAGNDAVALVLQATGPQWVSCGGNDSCSPREKVAQSIAGFHQAIPDLKWDIKEVLVAGDKVVVRGEATGTPAGAFMGVPHGGKSFRIMSIDVHTVAGGKIIRSHHIEDWMGAARQLAAK